MTGTNLKPDEISRFYHSVKERQQEETRTNNNGIFGIISDVVCTKPMDELWVVFTNFIYNLFEKHLVTNFIHQINMSTPPTTPMSAFSIEVQKRTNRYRTPAVVTPLLLSEGNDTTPEKSVPNTTAPGAPLKEKRPVHTVEPSGAKKLEF
jgi:hypothetical protein